MWLLYVILGLIVLWIVVAIVRALGRPRYPNTYGQMGPPAGYGPGQGSPGSPGYGQGPIGRCGGGGGGFLSNMLGGMFGAAAGNWIYDSFFRGSGSGMGPSYEQDPRRMQNQPMPPGYPEDTGIPGNDFERQPRFEDSSGAGGDFGDDDQAGGAGGDFGDNDQGEGGADISSEDSGDGSDFGGGDFGDGDCGGGDSGGGGDF